MPFGLTNSPATFQRALGIILSGFKWKTCLIYLDDAIASSNLTQEHLRHVTEILLVFEIAHVLLGLSKCQFFRTTVTYLGHIVIPGNLEIKDCEIKSMEEVLPSRNRRELRSLSWSRSAYSRFVQNFAHIACQLNKMLLKDLRKLLKTFSPNN